MAMRVTTTTRYDTADHLRSSEEVAAYLEATFEEASGDTAFIAKAWARSCDLREGLND